MNFIRKKGAGIVISAVIATLATFLASLSIGSFSFDIIGAPVFAIVIGMIITAIFPKFASVDFMKEGITFTSKKILQ